MAMVVLGMARVMALMVLGMVLMVLRRLFTAKKQQKDNQDRT